MLYTPFREEPQKFDSKLKYCKGLQDSMLNNGCALEERKSSYTRDCAANFIETNVGGTSGGTSNDDRLGTSCRYDVANAPTRAEWCKDIANENVHNFCMWDARRENFKQKGCTGSFSDLPDNLAFVDDGLKKINSSSYKYRMSSYYTNKLYRKSFKLNPAESTVFSMNQFNLKARTCEKDNQTQFTGKIIHVESKVEESFDPKMDTLILDGGEEYLVVFDIHNKGLCKVLHLEVRVQTD